MTNGGIEAGRLYLEAEVDTTGLSRELKAKVEAQTKNVRAKIKTEIDSRGLITQAREAAKAASGKASVKVKAQVDPRGMAAQIRTAVKEASAGAVVKVRAELDDASAAQTAAALKAVAAARTAKVNVDPDTAKATAEMAAWRRAQERPITPNVNPDTGGGGDGGRGLGIGLSAGSSAAGTALMHLSKLPALAGGISLLTSAVVGLAGGLVAVVSAASQASYALAVIPNLVGVAAQGIGVLLAGFSGIGEAVGALGQQTVSAGADAKASAEAQAAAARRVADAKRSLKDAQDAAARSARDSARAIADAERSLADARRTARQSAIDNARAIAEAERAAIRAHQATRIAQMDLNDARREARDRIREMNQELRLMAGDEQAAVEAVTRAREDLQDVQWDAASSEREERAAQAALAQAENDLARFRAEQGNLRRDVAEANREGVSGSDEVRSAREALRSAIQNERDAERGVADARRQARIEAQENARAIKAAERGVADAKRAAAEQAAASARSVADAQRNLRDAQREAAKAANEESTAQTAVNQAMDNLSPAGQRFARFIEGVLLPRLKDMKFAIQETLLPPVQRGIRAAMPFLDTLQKGLVRSAEVMGGWIERVGNLLGSDAFRGRTESIMKTNNRALKIFGDAALNLIVVLSKLAKVAGPTLLIPFAKWVRALTSGWRESLKTREGMENLREKLVAGRETVRTLWNILKNLWGTLRNVGKAATPVGDSLLKSFEKATAGWRKWTASDVGQGKMRDFFDATKPVFKALSRLGGQLLRFIVLLGQAGGGPLVILVNGLTWLLDKINDLMGVPFVGEIVAWGLALAGVAGGLGMIAAFVLNFVKRLRVLGTVFTAIRTGLAAFRTSLFMTRVGLAALWVQAKLVALWTKISAGAMWIFNTAMRGNPVIAIVSGIMLLVGALILAYKKFDWFRKIVDTVFGAIVDAAKWVWDVLFGHSIFPDMLAAFKTIFDAIGKVISLWVSVVKFYFGLLKGIVMIAVTVVKWLWDKAFKPALAAIGKALVVVWNKVLKPVFKALWKGLQVIGGWAKWLWNKAIKPAWSAIGKAISFYWNKVLKPVFKFLWKGLETIGGWAKWLWAKAIKPAWSAIGKAIEFYWNRVIKPVFRFLWRGLETIGGWFKWLWNKAVRPAWNAIKDAISFAWNKVIRPVFDKLVTFVKTTIPNAFEKAKNGIKSIWDKIKGIVATPIRFVVNTVYNNGLRRMINAIPGVDDLNPITVNWARGTSSVLPGYTPNRDPHTFVSTDGRMRLGLSGGEGIIRPEVVRMLGSRAVDFVNGAARRGGNALASALASLAPRFAGFRVGGTVGGSGTRNTGGGARDLVRDATAAMMGNARALTPRQAAAAEEEESSWRKAISAILSLISNIRGWVSGMGRFGDWGNRFKGLVGSVGGKLVSWLNDKIPNSISVPGPNIPLPDNPIGWPFDRGGALYPGATLAVNQTGKVETVFTNDQITRLSANLANLARDLVTMGTAKGGAALVEHLHLSVGDRRDLAPALSRTNRELRKIQLGGVHAQRLG